MKEISTNQIKYINDLMQESNETSLQVGAFLIDKGIEKLNTQQASYLINILKKYNKEIPSKKVINNVIKDEIKIGVLDLENSYSGYGWKGVNYDMGLSTKEIAKKMRKEVKRLYPNKKFSITTEYNHINVYLVQTNVSPFKDEKDIKWHLVHHKYELDYGIKMEDFKNDYFRSYVKGGNMQINNFHLDKDWRLTQDTKDMFVKINDILKSFNMDDSDCQTDYFHSKFYTDLGIGKWDKQLIVTEVK